MTASDDSDPVKASVSDAVGFPGKLHMRVNRTVHFVSVTTSDGPGSDAVINTDNTGSAMFLYRVTSQAGGHLKANKQHRIKCYNGRLRVIPAGRIVSAAL